MAPGGFETSLLEATTALLSILGLLVLVAVVAGVFTLPIFFGALGFKVAWFWASDVNSGPAHRRVLAGAMRVGMPAFSLVATLFSLGYYGAYDWPARVVGAVEPYKQGPIQKRTQRTFDGATRWVGERVFPALATDVKVDWTRAPDKAIELEELWKKETAPPEDHLAKLFPDRPTPENVVPDEPPPAPDAVKAKVGQYIAGVRSGAIYEGTQTQEASKETIRAADDYFERSVRESNKARDGKIVGYRSLVLYCLLVLGPIPLLVFATAMVLGRRGVVLGMRNIVRALLRTSLTYLAVFVLTFMLCCIWSVLAFLGAITAQKDTNMKGIVTEKYQIPSQMKPSHFGGVKQLIEELPGEHLPEPLLPDTMPAAQKDALREQYAAIRRKPVGERTPADVAVIRQAISDNTMTWAFVGGTLDKTKMTPQNSLFFFATEPEKLLPMMPGMDELPLEDQRKIAAMVEIMRGDPKAVVIGAEKLRQMNKRVGDRMKVTSLNYKEIEFDFTIVGEFPSGSRWEQSAVMNRSYLDNELDAYRGRANKDHPLADKCMNLIWIRLPTPKAFDELSKKISEGKFAPAIKMEIESSAYANFLSPFKTLLWFMKYPLSIGLLTITTLVASLVIGIGVRERKTEIAVLKVLGFRPWMVLGLILGESLLVGTLSGFMATATAFMIVNAMGGLALPIAFFNKFFVPEDALWWGPLIGGLTALIGSVLPSASAYRIKASQVFSRVT